MKYKISIDRLIWKEISFTHFSQVGDRQKRLDNIDKLSLMLYVEQYNEQWWNKTSFNSTRKLTKIDHTLSHKAIIYKFHKTEIIQNVFSPHIVTKAEVNNKIINITSPLFRE